MVDSRIENLRDPDAVRQTTKRRIATKLPAYYQTDPYFRFFDASVDHFFQPGDFERLNGFIGQKPSWHNPLQEFYIKHPSKERDFYALEPSAISRNIESGVLQGAMFYPDFINDLRFKGSRFKNPNKVLSSPYYSWHPPIDADKLLNFQQYYWVRGQLEPIEILSKTNVEQEVIGKKNFTFSNINLVEAELESVIEFEPNIGILGDYRCPDNWYDFPDRLWDTINIKKLEWLNENGTVIGTIPFNCIDIQSVNYEFNRLLVFTGFIPKTAVKLRITRDPRKLPILGWDHTQEFEESNVNQSFNQGDLAKLGLLENITVANSSSRTGGYVDWSDLGWDDDCLQLSDEDFEIKSLTLSSGMAVRFRDDVNPEFNNKVFIVEGVGRSIRLVEDEFNTPEKLDRVFFPDFITIEREAIDGNEWSATNRWFHKDVIKFYDGLDAVAATKPIIEFERDLELYNYGKFRRQPVDIILDIDNGINQKFIEDAEGLVDGDGNSLLSPNLLYVNETFWSARDIQSKVTFLETPYGPTLVQNSGETPSVRVSPINSPTGRVVTDLESQISGWTSFYDHDGWDNWWWDGEISLYDSLGISDLVVDNVTLRNGTRILVTSENNPNLNNRVYRVDCIDEERRVVLKLETDGLSDVGAPVLDEVIRVTQGTKANTIYHFDGTNWVISQQKTITNQEPLFTLWDVNGVALDDPGIYQDSNFFGSRIFGYQNVDDINVPVDNDLNFRIRRDEQAEPFFENYLVSERYTDINGEITGFYFYRKNAHDPNITEYSNNWNLVPEETRQKFVQEFIYTGETIQTGGQVQFVSSVFPQFDENGNFDPRDAVIEYNNTELEYNKDWIYDLDDEEIIIFVRPLNNGARFIVKTYTLDTPNENANKQRYVNEFIYEGETKQSGSIQYNLQIPELIGTDIERVEVYATNPEWEEQRPLGFRNEYFLTNNGSTIDFRLAPLEKNTRFIVRFIEASSLYDDIDPGFFEIPQNLQANPNNETFTEVSRSQIIPHLIENVRFQNNLEGSYFFDNNYRDTEKSKTLGRQILQHTSPLIKAMALSSDRRFDFSLAAQFADREYNRFRNKFVKKVNDFWNRGLISQNDAPDDILRKIFDSLNAAKTRTSPFFGSSMGIIESDELILSTWIPASPSFLGVAPVYLPHYERDRTFLSPVDVIIGHDGSMYIRQGDVRDDVILLLEQRIYESVLDRFKGESRPTLQQAEVTPGKWRKTELSREETNKMFQPFLERWIVENRTSYRVNEQYSPDNPFTWNYSTVLDVDGDALPGYWYNIYRYFFDTIKPNTHPWEMVGFSEKPSWWNTEYGPGPRYTRRNIKLWNDMRDGVIRQGPRAGTHQLYKRPDLLKFLPIDDSGSLLDPIQAGIVRNRPSYENARADFTAGDGSPVEEAWRRSNSWPFAYTQFLFISRPAQFIEQFWDHENTEIAYPTGENPQFYHSLYRTRVPNSQLRLHYENNDDGTPIIRIGVQQWIADRLRDDNLTVTNTLAPFIRGIDVALGHKHSGYVEINRSRFSNEVSGIIPQENYSTVVYRSPSIREEFYGGVIVMWNGQGFMIWGYDVLDPKFTVIHGDPNGKKKSVQIGERPVVVEKWKRGVFYPQGVLVEFEQLTYRCIEPHNSGQQFNPNFWNEIPTPTAVPDARVVRYLEGLQGDPETEYAYGHVFYTRQDLAEFLWAYERKLEKQGWLFDDIIDLTNQIKDWEWSVRQFLIWTLHQQEIGNTIHLSPLAERANFRSTQGQVENIEQVVNGVYAILNTQGFFIDSDDTTVSRFENELNIQTFRGISQKDLDIYAIRLFVTETEHVTIFDNETIFKDLIYRPLFNIRLPRITFGGIRTRGWNGRYDAPGFVLDRGIINANFEKSADDFRRYYQLENQVTDATLRDRANHLIGYQPRDYLSTLVVSDLSQVNFYQGMIRQKGTGNSINRLLRSGFITNASDLSFFEEWAIRRGSFGALDSRPSIEFQLLQREYGSNPQVINFETTTNPNLIGDNPLTTEIEIVDVVDENGNLVQRDPRWKFRPREQGPIFGLLPNNVVNDKIVPRKGDLPTAGYVVPAEVTYTSFLWNTLLNFYEINKTPEDDAIEPYLIQPGETMWIYNTQNVSWSKYFWEWTVVKLTRPVNDGLQVQIIEQDENMVITIDTLKAHTLKIGEIIVITPNTLDDTDTPIEGTFQVEEILDDNRFTIRGVLTEQEADLIGQLPGDEPLGTPLPEIADGRIDYTATNPEVDVPETQPEIWVYREARFFDRTDLQFNIESINPTIGDYIWVDDDRIYDFSGSIKIGEPFWSTYTIKNSNNNEYELELVRKQNKRVDSLAIRNALIYDQSDNATRVFLQVFDPVKGLIPGIAKKEINVIGAFDPAIYTHGDDVFHNIRNVQAWGKESVGKTWWDLSTLRYLDYEIDSNSYRIQNWGSLAPGSSIDIYEWVRSTVPPTAWSDAVERSSNDPADNNTPTGEAKDPLNPGWTQVEEFDSINGRNKVVYYFWVKNKLSIPPVDFRNLSVYTVRRMIEDPESQGIPYFTPISENTMILNGSFNFLNDDDSFFQLNWQLDDDLNIHREWLLMREGDSSSLPPDDIFIKLVDSVTGLNSAEEQVPDPRLTEGERYGVALRPRQSMFLIDDKGRPGNSRRAAVETINNIFADICLDLERPGWDECFFQGEPEPDVISPEFASEAELETTAQFRVSTLAEREDVYRRGDLDGPYSILVEANEETANKWTEWKYIGDNASGWDFRVWDYVTTTSQRNISRTELDDINYNLVPVPGVFDANGDPVYTRVQIPGTNAEVVVFDSTEEEGWDLHFDPLNGNPQFELLDVQAWQLEDFWNKIDWFAEGFDSSILPRGSREFATFRDFELATDLFDGDIARIIDEGDGRFGWWLYDTSLLENSNVPYRRISKEKCTIELSSQFFNPLREVFPSPNEDFAAIGRNLAELRRRILNRDGTQELREILLLMTGKSKNPNCDQVMTNEEFNRFWFDMLHYAHAEQSNIDWAFKTSTITVVGFDQSLTQTPLVQQDFQDAVTDYINEVKPYHIKIRDFRRQVQLLDVSDWYVTDFDKPMVEDQNEDTGFAFASIDKNPEVFEKRPGLEYIENKDSEFVRRVTSELRFDRVDCVADIADGQFFDEAPFDTDAFDHDPFDDPFIVRIPANNRNIIELPDCYWDQANIEEVKIVDSENEFTSEILSPSEYISFAGYLDIPIIESGGDERNSDEITRHAKIIDNIPEDEIWKVGSQRVIQYLRLFNPDGSDRVVSGEKYIEVRKVEHQVERIIRDWKSNSQLEDESDLPPLRIESLMGGAAFAGTEISGSNFKQNELEPLYQRSTQIELGFDEDEFDEEPFDDFRATVLVISEEDQIVAREILIDTKIDGGFRPQYQAYFGDGETRKFRLPESEIPIDLYTITVYEGGIDEGEGTTLQSGVDFKVFDTEIITFNAVPEGYLLTIKTTNSWLPAPTRDYDIEIVGGDFHQPQLGPCVTEEHIPIRIPDPMDMLIFQRPTPGVPKVFQNRQVTKEGVKQYRIGQVAQHIDGIQVFLNGRLLVSGKDYKINWPQGEVELLREPMIGSKLLIWSVNLTGIGQILETCTFNDLGVITFSGNNLDSSYEINVVNFKPEEWTVLLTAQNGEYWWDDEEWDTTLFDDSRGQLLTEGRHYVVEDGQIVFTTPLPSDVWVTMIRTVTTEDTFTLKGDYEKDQLVVTVNGEFRDFDLNGRDITILGDSVAFGQVVTVTVFEAPKYILMVQEQFKSSEGPIFDLISTPPQVQPLHNRLMVYKNGDRLCGPDTQWFVGDGVRTQFNLQNKPCCFRDIEVYVDSKRNTKEEVRKLGTWGYDKGFDEDRWDADFDPIQINVAAYTADYDGPGLAEKIVVKTVCGYDDCGCPIIEESVVDFLPEEVGYCIDGEEKCDPVIVESLNKRKFDPEAEWDNFDIKFIQEGRIFFIKKLEKNMNPPSDWQWQLNPFGPALVENLNLDPVYDWMVFEIVTDLDCELGTYDFLYGWDDDDWDSVFDPSQYTLDGSEWKNSYRWVTGPRFWVNSNALCDKDPSYQQQASGPIYFYGWSTCEWDSEPWDKSTELNPQASLTLREFKQFAQNLNNCNLYILEPVITDEEYCQICNFWIETAPGCGYWVIDPDQERTIEFASVPRKISGKDNQWRVETLGTWGFGQDWGEDVWDADWNAQNYPIECSDEGTCKEYFVHKVEPLTLPFNKETCQTIPSGIPVFSTPNVDSIACLITDSDWDDEDWSNTNLWDGEIDITPSDIIRVVKGQPINHDGLVNAHSIRTTFGRCKPKECCNAPPEITSDQYRIMSTVVELEKYCELPYLRYPNHCECSTYILCEYPSPPLEMVSAWVTRDFSDVPSRCETWDDGEWDPCDNSNLWGGDCANDVSGICYRDDTFIDFAPNWDEDDWNGPPDWDESFIIREDGLCPRIEFCHPPSPQSTIVVVNPEHEKDCNEGCFKSWEVWSSNQIRVYEELEENDEITVVWFNDFFETFGDNTEWDYHNWDELEWQQAEPQDTEMKIRTHTFPANESGTYIISRPPFEQDMMWVSINGKEQIRDVDYVLEKLGDSWDTQAWDWGRYVFHEEFWDDEQTWIVRFKHGHCCGEEVCITTIAGRPGAPGLAWKMFLGSKGKWEYNKIDSRYIFTLKEDLFTDSTEVQLYINDQIPREIMEETPFHIPDLENNVSGVVYVGGERIEYWSLAGPQFDDNGKEYWILGQIVRGTESTSDSVVEFLDTVNYAGDGETNIFAIPQSWNGDPARIQVYLNIVDCDNLGFDENPFDEVDFDSKAPDFKDQQEQHQGADYEVQNGRIVFNQAPIPPQNDEQPNVRVSVIVENYENSKRTMLKGVTAYDGSIRTEIPGGYQWRSRVTPWDEDQWDQISWGNWAKPINEGMPYNENHMTTRYILRDQRNK